MSSRTISARSSRSCSATSTVAPRWPTPASSSCARTASRPPRPRCSTVLLRRSPPVLGGPALYLRRDRCLFGDVVPPPVPPVGLDFGGLFRDRDAIGRGAAEVDQ